MREDIASILLSEEQIHTRVRELGEEISRDYAGKEPLFVGVLKGCFVLRQRHLHHGRGEDQQGSQPGH